MKTIIVYYSLEGNTEYVAQTIANQLDADLLRIEPAKSYPTGGFRKFFWGGKSAVMGETPELVSKVLAAVSISMACTSISSSAFRNSVFARCSASWRMAARLVKYIVQEMASSAAAATRIIHRPPRVFLRLILSGVIYLSLFIHLSI